MFGLRRRFAEFRSFWVKRRGVFPRQCPICDFKGLFTAFGDPPRWDAKCPSCGSLERHRLLALYLAKHPVSGRVVHFAPEPAMRDLLKPMASEYQSADLLNPADLVLNIENIGLPDESVNVFVASHVLEHVDDARALSEMQRCLRPGGKLILMVPIIEGWATSYENPAAVTTAERTLHFGQWDHVRFYGRDFRDRVKSAGFSLAEYSASGEECVRFALSRGESVFVAAI